jgi:hypothetical protein
MQLRHLLRMVVWCLAFVWLCPFSHARAQEPILEKYVLGFGSDNSMASEGVVVDMHDKAFGGGNAQAHLYLKTEENADSLRLNVWRLAKKGETSFALLVFRIEVRGYDFLGKSVFSQDLDGFTFGDSSSGWWWKSLKIPADVQLLHVTFVGNYE